MTLDPISVAFQRGLGPFLFRLVPGTKRPSEKLIDREPMSEQEARDYLRNGGGLGLQCGEASGVFVIVLCGPMKG